MKKTYEWTAEELSVPKLGRTLSTGDIFEADAVIGDELVDQRKARASDVTPVAVVAEAQSETDVESTTSVSVPILITKAQRAKLNDAGFSPEEIDAKTPQQAHAHLGEIK